VRPTVPKPCFFQDQASRSTTFGGVARNYTVTVDALAAITQHAEITKVFIVVRDLQSVEQSDWLRSAQPG
jgi:hypothetical protein